MTKAEIVEKISGVLEVSKKDADTILTSVFGIITEALNKGEEVAIPKFGKFVVKETKERNGVNPATGEKLVIPSKKAVKFKPATALKEQINE